MKLIRNMIRFFFSKIVLIITLVIAVVFLGVFLFFNIEAFNSATWIYSASMQTLGTLIALLPISYGYYIANLDNEKNNNLDRYIINRLKQDVYYDMMSVIFFAIIVIVMNLISFFIDYQGIYTFIIIFFTTISIGQISIYIYHLFDPNKVNEILKEFDAGTIVPGQKEISLDQFITEYLNLEVEVKDYITNQHDNEVIANLPLYDIVDKYSKNYPEIDKYYQDFKEIIFHRNNLIHNYADTQVDYSKYQNMLNLKEYYRKLNIEFVQNNIFKNITSVKNIIEQAIKDFQLTTYKQNNNLIEDIISSLHAYFVSDYYECVSDESNQDVDFEIFQNNYSRRKLVGIDVLQSPSKNMYNLAKNYFKRFEQRYLYLTSIFFDNKTKEIVIYYQTKDKQIKRVIISYSGE